MFESFSTIATYKTPLLIEPAMSYYSAPKLNTSHLQPIEDKATLARMPYLSFDSQSNKYDIAYNGYQGNATQWANALGIGQQLLVRRFLTNPSAPVGFLLGLELLPIEPFHPKDKGLYFKTIDGVSLIQYKGHLKSFAQWADELKCSYAALRMSARKAEKSISEIFAHFSKQSKTAAPRKTSKATRQGFQTVAHMLSGTTLEAITDREILSKGSFVAYCVQKSSGSKRPQYVIHYQGVAGGLAAWASELGINRSTLKDRIQKWKDASLQQILFTPNMANGSEDAIQTKPEVCVDEFGQLLFKANGRWETLKSLAKDFDLPLATVKHRLAITGVALGEPLGPTEPYDRGSKIRPHGTWARYSFGGCRCDLCKAAAAQYQKELAARNRAKKDQNKLALAA